MLTAVSPAGAALETPDVYAAQVVGAGLTGAEETEREACVPPDPQYIPAFVRNANGTIIGIKYTIIEYMC
ncbi:hypothetical protein [Pararhizobium sp. A13]|uniref:hypothetical protein n=1 Tax=Pararhizobium sp. A13 TaxID=3133975 RepID=UPI0032436242